MLRAAPFIAYYRLTGHSSSDYQGQWDSYWGSVSATGKDGEVLPQCERTFDLALTSMIRCLCHNCER